MIDRFVEERTAKFKYIDTHPQLIAVDLSRPLLPFTMVNSASPKRSTGR